MKPIAVVTPGHSPYHANYNNPVMFTDPLGLCPECPRDKRYYDARDNFMDYEPTSYVSPNLNGDNWMVWTGRHRDHWSDGIGFGNGFSSSDFNALWNSAFGGSWATSQGVDLFGSHSEAFSAGLGYNEYHNSWGSTTFGSIGRGRRLAQHHFNGDFVQIGGDGKVYVPYTNVSYWDYKANAADNYNLSEKSDTWYNKNYQHIDGKTVGISGTLALVGGITFELGGIWSGDRKSAPYFSIGSAYGIDASIGIEIKNIYNNNRTPFKIGQYEGFGTSDNVGIGFVDFIYGGDMDLDDPWWGLDHGHTYQEYGFGVSYGIPAAYTRQYVYTWVFD